MGKVLNYHLIDNVPSKLPKHCQYPLMTKLPLINKNKKGKLHFRLINYCSFWKDLHKFKKLSI